MKSKITIFFLLTLVSNLHAQISLDTSDLPQSGKAYQLLNAASLINYQHTAGSGQQQNWDYSGIFGQTSAQQLAFINPDPLGADSIFPGASLLSKDPQRGHSYYIKKPDGFYLDGVLVKQGNSSYTLNFNPDDLLLPLPCSLGSSRSYNSGYDLFIQDGNNKMKVEMRSENDFLADAYGSLQLPSGYYPNTLRVKKSTRYHSKVYFFFNGQYNLVHAADSNSTEYTWYAKGKASWLMRINADLNGVFKTGSYADESLSSAAIPANKSSGYRLYPNPASSTLQMQWPQAAAEGTVWELLGSDGRLLKTVLIPTGSTYVHININDIAAGVYLLHMYTPATLLFSERITITQ